jgi:hypothetical protein
MKIGTQSPSLPERLVTLRGDRNLRWMRFALRLSLGVYGSARDGFIGRLVGL